MRRSAGSFSQAPRRSCRRPRPAKAAPALDSSNRCGGSGPPSVGETSVQQEVLAAMKRFLVTYLAPASVIEEWKKTDPEKRKAAEEKMRDDWMKWMSKNANIFVDKGAGVGKTRRATAEGSGAGRNDIMLYAIVQADSHEAASKLFEDHPHLSIPSASI